MPNKQPPKEHQFKKGVSGNPAGKPKGALSLLNLLKSEIQKCPKGKDKKTYALLMVEKMLNESVKKGDIQHIKTIWAYIEGMPKQNVDVMSGGEKLPLLVQFMNEKTNKTNNNTDPE